MEMIKKCLNPKVLAVLAIIGIGIALLAPKAWVASIPLLLLAACPLSMVVMMVMMRKQHKSNEDKPKDKE